jgi:hypothetical protein
MVVLPALSRMLTIARYPRADAKAARAKFGGMGFINKVY